jgi:hypothetical protein
MSATSQHEDGEHRPLLADERDEGNGTGDAAASDVEASGTFSRNLGAREAFAIVISIVIGSGIFTSPGSIDTNVPSPGIALVIWLVGGVLAWTGASTMAELGTAIPGEGKMRLSSYGSTWSLFEQILNDEHRWCSAIPPVHIRRCLWFPGGLDVDRRRHAGDAGHSEHSLHREHILGGRCN